MPLGAFQVGERADVAAGRGFSVVSLVRLESTSGVKCPGISVFVV